MTGIEVREILKGTYELCIEVSEFCDNIIASAKKKHEDVSSDEARKAKADAFVKWYKDFMRLPIK